VTFQLNEGWGKYCRIPLLLKEKGLGVEALFLILSLLPLTSPVNYRKFGSKHQVMRKLILFCMCSLGFVILSPAQQLNNTAWKGMLNTFTDTVTMVFSGGFVNTSSTGIQVISKYLISGDPISIRDVGGANVCGFA